MNKCVLITIQIAAIIFGLVWLAMSGSTIAQAISFWTKGHFFPQSEYDNYKTFNCFILSIFPYTLSYNQTLNAIAVILGSIYFVLSFPCLFGIIFRRSLYLKWSVFSQFLIFGFALASGIVGYSRIEDLSVRKDNAGVLFGTCGFLLFFMIGQILLIPGEKEIEQKKEKLLDKENETFFYSDLSGQQHKYRVNKD